MPSTKVDGMTLLRCGVLAGPLFLVALFAQDAITPDFHPMKHPGSSLELGPYGWVQQVNFVVAGLLVLAFAAGLRRATRRWAGPVLIAVWGVGLIGAGVFVTDPVNGYPPGPVALIGGTWHGRLHDALSVPAFAALFVALLVMAPRWQKLPAVPFAVAFALSGMAFQHTHALVPYGGLFQRIAVVIGWLWLTALALRTLRHREPPRPLGPPLAPVPVRVRV
jgi:hypothetical protein